MDNDRQHRIRDRARAIWEPEGRPEDHWHQAVQELDAAEAALQGGTDSALGTAGTAPSGGAVGRGSGLSSGLQPGGTIPAEPRA